METMNIFSAIQNEYWGIVKITNLFSQINE